MFVGGKSDRLYDGDRRAKSSFGTESAANATFKVALVLSESGLESSWG